MLITFHRTSNNQLITINTARITTIENNGRYEGATITYDDGEGPVHLYTRESQATIVDAIERYTTWRAQETAQALGQLQSTARDHRRYYWNCEERGCSNLVPAYPGLHCRTHWTAEERAEAEEASQ